MVVTGFFCTVCTTRHCLFQRSLAVYTDIQSHICHYRKLLIQSVNLSMYQGHPYFLVKSLSCPIPVVNCDNCNQNYVIRQVVTAGCEWTVLIELIAFIEH